MKKPQSGLRIRIMMKAGRLSWDGLAFIALFSVMLAAAIATYSCKASASAGRVLLANKQEALNLPANPLVTLNFSNGEAFNSQYSEALTCQQCELLNCTGFGFSKPPENEVTLPPETETPVAQDTETAVVLKSEATLNPPVIGERDWQTIEPQVFPTGSSEWDRVSFLFEMWNNGSLELDDARYYQDRPDSVHQTGATEPGFSWFQFITKNDDPNPVYFKPRAPPQKVLLPRCQKTRLRRKSTGGVSICAVVRNEGKVLQEWLNYYNHLGINRISLFSDGSTDNSEEIARSYGDFVSFTDWHNPQGRLQWEIDQMHMYQECTAEQFRQGAKWVGLLDVDEYLVFDDPNQRLDIFLADFDQEHEAVGSVSFNWRMMHSNEISLPDPSFTVLDVRYACAETADERHHVKTFVKKAAYEKFYHPHFSNLKEGYRQYDVTGGIIDPPGPFASRLIPSPARLNHYRLLSLHEWLRKLSKRQTRDNGDGKLTIKEGDYGFTHLTITLGNCFPVQPEASAILNVLARQGCL